MGRRGKCDGKPGAYVERRANGQFKKWTSVGTSSRSDVRVHAKNHPSRSGYGHQGDYSKRK